MSTVSISLPEMIPVARPFVGREEELAVIEVLRSGWLTQGPRVAAFEKHFAAYVGCDHAIAVSSCTTALHLALLVQDIGPGDEVICPSLSFIATANAIAYTGATPVFVDIDPHTYNLDPACVNEAISPRTKAILVVHQVGLPAAMHDLLEVAARHGLPIVEDAACAIGSEYAGMRIGSPLGVMACFSFHPRKILTTGEGGMITTNDHRLAERLRHLRQHAMSLSDVARHEANRILTESYDEVGFNFRMTDLQAAIGTTQLGRLPDFLARRRQLAEQYKDALRHLPWLILPHVPDECRHNYQSYMVRLTDGLESLRDEFMQALREKNISTRRGIMAIHREAPYRTAPGSEHLPETEHVTDSGMILPLYHEMTDAEQGFIIESVLQLGQRTH